MRRLIHVTTASTLLGIGALHALWGRGSTFPFATRGELNDTVIGRDATPSAGACYAVAGLLTTASALVAGLPTPRSRLRRLGVGTVSVTLAARAALGFSGRTELVSPGSVSPRFLRMDKRYLSPLCAALAVGAAASLRG
jgi:Protein of unknown function (DUF3995)